jgi:chromosome segregation ATPase
MIAKIVDSSSKSDRACNRKALFIKTSDTINTEGSYFQEITILSAYEVLTLQHEAEILREQVESLKHELEYKNQLIEECKQELQDASFEIESLNCELQDIYNLKLLKLDEAKRLARNMLSHGRCTSESLAELLSAMYCVVVTADELEPIAQSTPAELSGQETP